MTDPEWLQIEPHRTALDAAQRLMDAWHEIDRSTAWHMSDDRVAAHIAAGPRLKAAYDLARSRYDAAMDAIACPELPQPVVVDQSTGVIVPLPVHKHPKQHRGGKDWGR